MKSAQPSIENLRWNLSMMYDGPNDPQLARDREEGSRLVTAFAEKWKSRCEEFCYPAVLAEALAEYEALYGGNGLHSLGLYYACMQAQIEMESEEFRALKTSLDEEDTDLHNKVAFFLLAIGKLPVERQQALLDDPRLAAYRHLLFRTFANASLKLEEEAEQAVTALFPYAHFNWQAMAESMRSADTSAIRTPEGKRRIVGLAAALPLLESQNPEVRRHAAKAVNAITGRQAATTAWAVNNAIGAHNKLLEMRIRDAGQRRPDRLRHVEDDVPTEIVDALLAAVTDAYPLAHRHARLKRSLLGRKTEHSIAYWERNVPYVAPNQKERSYGFQEAVGIVRRTVGKLDPHWAEILDRMLAEGRIDVAPRPGKQSGAFCAGWYPKRPTLILLNHTGTKRDVTTLGHEFGHALNNTLMARELNALTYGSPLVTAEVASTFVERNVIQELTGELDDHEQLSQLVATLDGDVAAVMRQVAIYRFEQDLHGERMKKGDLSPGRIGEIFRRRMEEYLGDAVTFESGNENWWVYIGQIFNPFYVYSYASGVILVLAMLEMVHNDLSAIELVNRFLATGGSMPPQAAFQRMGFDISEPSFWQSGLKDVERRLGLAEDLAQKLGFPLP